MVCTNPHCTRCKSLAILSSLLRMVEGRRTVRTMEMVESYLEDTFDNAIVCKKNHRDIAHNHYNIDMFDLHGM